MPNTELMEGIEGLLHRPNLEPEARRLIELALVAQECGVMPCLDGLAGRPLTVAAAMAATGEREAAGEEVPADEAEDAGEDGADGFERGGGGDVGEHAETENWELKIEN